MDLHEHRSKAPGEGLFGLIVLAISVLLLWQSWAISGFESMSSAGAVPMAAAAVMVIAALIVVIGDAGKRVNHDTQPLVTRPIVLFTLLVIAYAVALVPLGFILSSFLFLVIGTKMLYRGGWGFTVLLAAGSLAVIYILFRVIFQVILPEGIVPEREILGAIGDLFAGAEPAAEEGAQ
ncbi:tripartite tricarboxylate transporter TctB family protein [Paracoccaceae bacterium GXU_MW_L88]